MCHSLSSDADGFRRKIDKIVTWKAGARRAPNKPLQLLLMIACVQRGTPRMVPFAEMEQPLRDALIAFGPARKSVHPEYPFWHLQNDDVWDVLHDGKIRLRKDSSNPTAKELRDKCAAGGFLEKDYQSLKSSSVLQNDVIQDILNAHFPTSVHEDILSFFGLTITHKSTDPLKSISALRREVLLAYDQTCAISNFSLRLDNTIVGVEPAYLLWPQAGGRNEITNVVAMTPLHRKLFHLGVFTIDTTYRVRVSKRLSANNGFSELMGNYDGKKISLPADRSCHPSQDALEWHREEVFRK